MCRWSPDGVDTLEGISRVVFKLMLDVFNDIERGVRSEGGSYHLKEMLEEVTNITQFSYNLYKKLYFSIDNNIYIACNNNILIHIFYQRKLYYNFV